MPPLDVDEYLGDLEGYDLSEAQKRELLQTLWAIMCDCARLSFGLDPVQQVFGPALIEQFSEEAGKAISTTKEEP